MVYKTDQSLGRTPLDSILYSHTTLHNFPWPMKLALLSVLALLGSSNLLIVLGSPVSTLASLVLPPTVSRTHTPVHKRLVKVEDVKVDNPTNTILGLQLLSLWDAT